MEYGVWSMDMDHAGMEVTIYAAMMMLHIAS